MRRLFAVLYLLLAFLTSCTPVATPSDLPPAEPVLVFIHADSTGTPQLVMQTGPDLQFTTLPFLFPPDCSVINLYPNPVAPMLAIEFDCGGGYIVQVIDTLTGKSRVPAEDYQTDSHVQSWSTEGRYLFLRIDFLSNPRILRVDIIRDQSDVLPLPSTTYDLVSLPQDETILYSLNQGVGFGSEVWRADSNGTHTRQLLVETTDIVAYLRPSPDGSRVAYILLPDSQESSPLGELWIMDTDGSNAQFLADADAGHGYAPAWSPDGTQIAFVVRENSDDPQADLSGNALLSNIYLYDLNSTTLTPVTQFSDAIVETPVWSPDGSTLAFNVIKNGTIQVWVYERTGMLQPISGEAFSCCAGWVPEK